MVSSCLRGQPTSHNLLKRFFDGIDLLLQLLQHRFEGLGQVVLGGHFAKLPISIRRMYLKNERLDVFQIVDVLNAENLESVPTMTVTIFEMTVHPSIKIAGQTYVVKLAALIKRVYA